MTDVDVKAGDSGNADSFLRNVRRLLTVMLGLCILGAIGFLAAIPFIFAVTNGFFDPDQVEPAAEVAAFEWVAALMALRAMMSAIGFFFFRHLRRIVDSVSHRDPFAPVNAGRLRNIAWLVLAIQLLAIPMTSLAIWFDAAPYEPNVHHGSDGISLGALLLALILFILARVFRTGAAMRDELEGTV